MHVPPPHSHNEIYLHYFMQVMRESAQVHCKDKLVVYRCHHTLGLWASKYIKSRNAISSCFYVWTRNYTYLTSFEMVMHCLKYSGKQSSRTNANMCNCFDLTIISSPKFRSFLCFQHQINELFY